MNISSCARLERLAMLTFAYILIGVLVMGMSAAAADREQLVLDLITLSGPAALSFSDNYKLLGRQLGKGKSRQKQQ